MTESGAVGGRVGRIGTDWWATIIGLAVTVLAVAGLLPKIGW
ncbi:hypothetical protein [Mycolicibacterium sp. CBMA 226]|nr:hypothetical protein [Mycolicibacterium sp. CBMA 226]